MIIITDGFRTAVAVVVGGVDGIAVLVIEETTTTTIR
jgi:hypothetical protein